MITTRATITKISQEIIIGPIMVFWTGVIAALTKQITRGGGEVAYKSHIAMCRPNRLRFRPFWPENGYTLCPFWCEIGYGSRENCGSVWTQLSFQFQMNKYEIEIREFEMHLKIFCLCSNVSNDDIICA